MKYILLILIFCASVPVLGAASSVIPGISVNLAGASTASGSIGILKVLIGLTILTLAPAVLIMMTSFTRIVIVLSFLRQAMGTNNLPPTQLILGLALLLTFYTMSPTFNDIKVKAIDPYIADKIDQSQALEAAGEPFRKFMLKQTRDSDIKLFLEISGNDTAKSGQDMPFHALVASFVISELKTAFQIGFMLYLPFLIIDMVVASVLMAMGMMMMPPMMVSLPLKLLLFVLVDGWNLVIGNLLKSFG